MKYSSIFYFNTDFLSPIKRHQIMSQIENNEHVYTFYSPSKLATAVKAVYPGVKVLNVLIKYNWIKTTKIPTYYCSPLCVLIGKTIIPSEELNKKLNIESLFIKISESQYSYMRLHNENTYWIINIDCEKQSNYKDHDFYPSRLLFVCDDSPLVSKVMKPADEFVWEDSATEELVFDSDI